MRPCVVTAALAGLALAGRARAEAPICPPSIVVSETLRAVPDGWKAVTGDGLRRLDNVSVSQGPFEHLAALAPEDRETGKHTSEAIWAVHTGEELWLVCHYANSNVTVTRKLDPDIRKCVVSYKQDVMKTYVCK
jgi:hypothetical protein